MKKLMQVVLVICACGAMALAADKGMSGYITDAKCGVNGAAPGKEACAKKCIEAGEKAVFVTDKDKQVLAIDNQDATKGHEGHHVNIEGKVSADKKSVHIDKVTMIPDKKATGGL